MILDTKNLETKRLDLRVPTMKEQYRLWEILKDDEVNKWYFPTPDRFFKKEVDGKIIYLSKDKIEDLKEARKSFMKRFCNWDIQKPFYEKKIESIKNKENSNIFTFSAFIKGTDEVIGQMTCQPSSEFLTKMEVRDVGWYLDPKYHHQGYGYEMAERVLEYMFNEVGITDIYTSAATDNKGSCGIMEKLGFEKNGTYTSTYYDEDKILEATKYHGNKKLFLNRKMSTKK